MSDDNTDPSRVTTETDQQEKISIESSLTVAFTIWGERPQRHRYVRRDDGPGWWRFHEEWTGETWRTVGREPLVGIVARTRQPTTASDE